MSQPSYADAMAEAKQQYEEELKEMKFQPPHDGGGNCTSRCQNDMDCPVIPFEEWLEERK